MKRDTMRHSAVLDCSFLIEMVVVAATSEVLALAESSVTCHGEEVLFLFASPPRVVIRSYVDYCGFHDI